jgi:starch synthase
MLSSEIVPFAKTGGLADVAGALVLELRSLGHDVRAFMPLYAPIRAMYPDLRPVDGALRVPIGIGTGRYEFTLQTTCFPGTDVPIYFVDCPAMFDRAGFYTNDVDEHRRFLLFTRAVIEACQHMGFAPDVFHCNDWHTAFLPLYLKTVYSWDRLFARSRTLLTIHNIGYQGVMPAAAAADIGLGYGDIQLDQADLRLGLINSLKHGIRFADAVNTVSPTYAREICAAPLGMGLQSVLSARVDGVSGILNGVDYREWDPRVDPHLSVHFGPSDLDGKRANKRLLLASAGLSIAESAPLIGMVTRLTEQKGIDLLIESLPQLLAQRDCGLVVLGSGEARYVAFFQGLAAQFPGRVHFHAGYDEALAHLIEAGSDVFLMPSRYEPCGLNQMYSLRYGTIPIVHKTGGLADSVQHFDPQAGTGTGCVFNNHDVPAVSWALNTTLDWFADGGRWGRLMQNAMAQDFSWGRQVKLYEAIYGRLGRVEQEGQLFPVPAPHLR